MSEHWPESIKEINPYYQKPEQTLEYQLGLLGLKPEDIRTVILSHMHVDHAGYLYLSCSELRTALTSGKLYV